MRRIAVLLILSIALTTACTTAHGASTDSAAVSQIKLLEASVHEAMTHKDLDGFMALFAPDATLTAGGKTFAGQAAIRDHFAAAKVFLPSTQWVALTSGWRIQATAHGDTGTVHFECWFLDLPTKQLQMESIADATVKRGGGGWVFTTFTSNPGTPTASG